MDDRFHPLSILDYQDLRAAAFGLGSGCRSTSPVKTSDVENRAEFSSSSGDTNSKSRVTHKFEETEKTEISSGVKPGVEGAEHRLSSGERELATVANAASKVDILEKIRSKAMLSIKEKRGSEEVNASSLWYKSVNSIDDGKEPRTGKSSFEEVANAGGGKESQRHEESNGENLDVTNKSPLDELAVKVISILGPAGAGLLAVRDVPVVAELRKRLLPLAHRLALMPDQLRRHVLKEHDLNTDVPLKKADRPVSAFASQLRYGRNDRLEDGSYKESRDNMSVVSASSEEDIGDEFELGRILKQLGSVMIEVGLLVGRLCDQASSGAEIENAILESGTAKGRLIHYHSLSESIILSSKASCGSVKKAKSKIRKASAGEVRQRESEGFSGEGNQGSELWQQWHFDYGLLTVLTSPLYLKWKSPASLEGIDPNMASCSIAPSSWTHGADGDHSGLTIMHRGAALRVKIPPDCLLVQVGEAAQILSGGRIAATAHCVSRPPDAAVSRETFVVFLQPAWQRRLSPPSWSSMSEVLHPRKETPVHLEVNECSNSQDDARCRGSVISENESHVEIDAAANPEAYREVHELRSMLRAVPPLASRWSNGCTFAEFSKITTRQYYGADGRQSRR